MCILKKFLFLVFLFVVSFSTVAQVKTIKVKKEVEKPKKVRYYGPHSFNAGYCYKILSSDFYGKLNTTSKPDFSKSLSYAASGVSDYNFAYGPRGNIWINSYYMYLIPTKININDSVNVNLNGFNYRFCIGKIFTRRNIRFRLPVYIGFDTGRIKLKNDSLKSKNAFFSPLICVQPKFFFTPSLSISATLAYGFDISKSKWLNLKSNSDNITKIRSLNQSGYTLLVSLGYSIHR